MERLREEFDEGVRWADANQKPRTITMEELKDASQRVTTDIYGDVNGIEDMLNDLGIKVVDNN